MSCLLIPLLISVLPQDSLQRGVSYTAWWHDSYLSPEADSALALVRPDNVEWIALLTTWYQDSARATRIYEDTLRSPSCQSLVHAINRAHSLGIKVMLKPHVDCQNGDWRGMIVPDSGGQWFGSYRRFIGHFARLAESLQCEQLCIGTELDRTTEGHRADWCTIIDSVRAWYNGPITYAANWDSYSTSVPFWDAVDFIGVDAYFPLTNTNNPTVSQLVSAWNTRWLPGIESLQAQVQKPVLLTEIGYRSIDSCNIRPWDYGMQGLVDTAEQRDCYEAAFQVFWSKPWFRGFYWWNWTTSPTQGGPSDRDYTPHDKPAERVLRQWYQHSALREGRQGILPARLRSAPNPIRLGGRFELGLPCLAAQCEVFDASGRLCQRLDLRQPSPVTLSDMAAGVYYLSLRSDNFCAKAQLVVVR